ncbi:MAG: amino acid permease [Enterocloster clostridioformis]
MLLVGDWMVIGGGPIAAMIAFAIGAVFLLPIGAVFGELTAAIPISGGIIEYVDRTYGRYVSYITGWFLALGNGILCPWEAIAISTLVSDMFGDCSRFSGRSSSIPSWGRTCTCSPPS